MIELLCFGLDVLAVVLFAYYCYEALKSKSPVHGPSVNSEENSRTPQTFGEPELRNLTLLYVEKCELKNKILLAATDLAKVMKEKNEMASQRDELMEEVRGWQEKYDSYTLAMKNTLKEYDSQREKYEQEKEELRSSMLEVRAKNEARFKVKIQDLQAALTTEHLRSAASLNRELQAQSELQVSKSRIAELELMNANQSKRIAQLELELLSKSSKNEGILDNVPVQVEVRTDDMRYLPDEKIGYQRKCVLSSRLIKCRKLFAQEKLLS